MRDTSPFISSVARHEMRWLRRLCYAQSIALIALTVALILVST